MRNRNITVRYITKEEAAPVWSNQSCIDMMLSTSHINEPDTYYESLDLVDFLGLFKQEEGCSVLIGVLFVSECNHLGQLYTEFHTMVLPRYRRYLMLAYDKCYFKMLERKRHLLTRVHPSDNRFSKILVEYGFTESIPVHGLRTYTTKE